MENVEERYGLGWAGFTESQKSAIVQVIENLEGQLDALKESAKHLRNTDRILRAVNSSLRNKLTELMSKDSGNGLT
jgi:hypothetical protein